MTLSNGTATLNVELAEQLIRRMTDGLVNIVDTTGEFLLHLEDGSIIDTKGWGGWEWTHGVGMSDQRLEHKTDAKGFLYNGNQLLRVYATAHFIYPAKHAAVAPSKEAAAYSIKTLKNWYNARYEETKGKGAPKNINTMAVMYALACMVEDGSFETEEEKQKWTGWLDEWAEWVMHGLNREWLPDPEARNRSIQGITSVVIAKYQFLMHINYLMDTTTGLWFHGWQFDGKGGGHNYAEALLTQLPPTDPIYRTLVSTLRRQVDALVNLQDEKTGLWHTLLTDPSSYVETSAAAGFSAGIFMALRLVSFVNHLSLYKVAEHCIRQQGYLSGEQYLTVASTALQGVIAQIRPDGEVENVSFGTAMGSDLDFYRNIAITPMPYGQALAMLALVEWERHQKAM
ncbi:hypothetical protein QFC19_008567 [Naganishia cerealis]|uniref:Uncharacterized protein n=1 Tax=Naganishia cerealis TaxID=610337 RepID=A0ACC2V0H9_9TREE|nr:hypothetical protein QFC19_008567 [Naganishia cerealis]